ncbi:MAG: glycosyltransferase [Clostridiales bacterium]|nr:glycosyltransferase [Clostridiales bacterium]
MKITFIIENLNAAGGRERVLTSLANSLVKLNYNVDILDFGKNNKFDLDRKINVIHSTIRIIDKNSKSLFYYFYKTILIYFYLILQKKYIITSNIVIGFGTVIGTICLFAGLKNKIIIADRDDPYSVPKFRVMRLVRNMIYYRADGYVFQTSEMQNYFKKQIEGKEIRIILNPISRELPEPYEGMREKRIVNFCRLEPQKNLTLLIMAFKKFHETHKGYHLEIYGSGSEKTKLVKLIKDNHLDEHVFIKEFNLNVHSLVLNAMIFVSSSNHEGLSNSMLEAMAIGIPTIATDCPIGGARTVIEHGVNGLLTKVGDISQLVRAMEMIAEDESLQLTLSRNGQKLRSLLNVDAITNEWISFINNILNLE